MLSKLFPSLKTAEKALDAIKSTGDALVFTGEERANWTLQLYRSMLPFNVAMRLLAVGIFSVWALHLMTLTVTTLMGLDYGIDEIMSDHIDTYFDHVMMFYFGSATLNGAIRTMNEKGTFRAKQE